MKKILTVAAAAVLMTGCATQTTLVNGNSSATPTYVESQKFFVSGIGQEKVVDAAKVCGGASKVAKVESVQEAKDGLLSFVTFGIYTPRTAKVYCK